MKTSSIIIAAGAMAIASSASAQVQEPAPQYKVNPQVQIVERNDRGMATAVKVGDARYPVCMSEREDGCIQPRAAGLGFGERPLGYWPGESS